MKWKNSNGTFEWELRFGYAFASFPFKSNKKKILCLREQHHFIHPFWDTTLFIRSFRKLVHLPKRQHAEQVMELRSQLDAIAKDQYEKIGLGFIDQVMWFDKYRQ